MAVKRCPSCGSDRILAKIIYGATAQSLEDGTFKILQQGSKYEIEPVQCAHCKTLFNNGINDLVEMQVCKTCGKPSLDIDENGECDICRTMKERPDLANLTQEDLIRLVLKMEKNGASAPVPTTAPAVEEEKVNTEENNDISPVASSKLEAARAAINNATPQTEEAPTEEKPKRGRRKVAKVTDDPIPEETKEEVQEAVEPTPEEQPVENANVNTEDPFSAAGSFDMFDNNVQQEVPTQQAFEEEQAF